MTATGRTASIFTLAALPLAFISPQSASAQSLPSFAVITGQSLTNTGPTTIVGNIAVSPGISFTGAGSVTQTGTTFVGDAVGVRIQNDLTTLYSYLAGRPTSSGGNLTGQDLGGKTLLPGVYNYDSGALLAAGQTLRLNAQGNPDAIFIINIGSTLTVGSGARVILENGAQGGNVFYRIGSSATLNTSADFYGQVVALTSVTLNTAATVDCGAIYARNGSVTLDANTIGICVLDSGGFEEVVDEGGSGEEPADGGDGGTPDGGGVPDGGGGEPDGGSGGNPDEGGGGDPDGGGGDGGEPDGEEDPDLGGGDGGVPDGGTPGDGGGDGGGTPDGGEGPGEGEPTPGPTDNGPTADFSDNAVSIAGALTTFEGAGGTLPVSIAILPATQGPAELAMTLDQLAGEISTGVAQIGLQSTDSLIDLVTRSTPGPVIQLVTPPSDAGVPVGRVPDRSNDYQNKIAAPAAAPAFTPEAMAVTSVAPQQNWNLWASGFGGRSDADASSETGTRRRTIDNQGFAVGLDLHATADNRFGVALAFDQSSLVLGAGAGSAEGTGKSAAIYGRNSYDKVYIEAVLAYGQHDIMTERTVTVAGTDSFTADVTTDTVAGQIEIGYRLARLTPFAALRGQRLTTPAYSETTTAGASTFALQYEEQTTESLRSEVGVAFDLIDSARTSVAVQTSWAHEFMDDAGTRAAFQSVPEAVFATSGARTERNSVIVAVQGAYGFGTGFYTATDITAEYSSGAQNYGGSLTVGYRW